MERRAVVALLGFAACTTSTTVRVELAFDLPDFIAYREGTSGWKTPKPSTGGKYAAHRFDLEVTGDYELIAVTIDPDTGTAVSTELRATSDDGSYWYINSHAAYEIDGLVVDPSYPATLDACLLPDMPLDVPGAVIASGTMVQPGRVSIGGWCTTSSKASWPFQLSVAPGTHDVIATDPLGTTSPRLAISRQVAIDAATTLPTIDLAADGQPLDTASITVVNTGALPNDAGPISSGLVLLTATEGAVVASGTDQVFSRSHVVPVVPASLLETTDSQVLTISVTDNINARRAASTRHPTETSVFELLSEPAPAYSSDGGVVAVTWSDPLNARVEAVDVETYRFASASGVTSEAVTATKRWLDAHQASSLAFDLDVPNFDPSWAVDLTQTHTTYFTVRAVEGKISYATSLSN